MDQSKQVDNVNVKAQGGEFFFPTEAVQWHGLKALTTLKDQALKGMQELRQRGPNGGMQTVQPQGTPGAQPPQGITKQAPQPAPQPAPMAQGGYAQPSYRQGGFVDRMINAPQPAPMPAPPVPQQQPAMMAEGGALDLNPADFEVSLDPAEFEAPQFAEGGFLDPNLVSGQSPDALPQQKPQARTLDAAKLKTQYTQQGEQGFVQPPTRTNAAPLKAPDNYDPFRNQNANPQAGQEGYKGNWKAPVDPNAPADPNKPNPLLSVDWSKLSPETLGKVNETVTTHVRNSLDTHYKNNPHLMNERMIGGSFDANGNRYFNPNSINVDVTKPGWEIQDIISRYPGLDPNSVLSIINPPKGKK